MASHQSLMNASFKDRYLQYKVHDYSITLKDRVDVDILSFILQNWKDFSAQFREKKEQAGAVHGIDFKLPEIHESLIAYSSKLREGAVDVTYVQKHCVGRCYGRNGMALQRMPKIFRQTVISNLYVDIDIKNCHPTLLVHICQLFSIPCQTLEAYVNDRDDFLCRNSLSLGVGKQVMLSVMNGGTKAFRDLSVQTPQMRHFVEIEMPYIVNAIITEFRNEYNTYANAFAAKMNGHHLYNDGYLEKKSKSSFVSCLLQDVENSILMEIRQCFKTQIGAPFEYEVLCYDGIMIPSNCTYDLRQCEEHIYNTMGIHIELVMKPFDAGFDLSSMKVPQQIHLTPAYFRCINDAKVQMRHYIRTKNSSSDGDLAQFMYILLKDDVVTYNRDGDGYVYDPIKAIWVEFDCKSLPHEISNDTSIIQRVLMEMSVEYNAVYKYFHHAIDKQSRPESRHTADRTIIIDDNNDDIELCFDENIEKTLGWFGMQATVCPQIGLTKVKREIKILEKIGDRLLRDGSMQVYKKLKMKLYNSDFKTLKMDRKYHHYLPIKNEMVIDLKTGSVFNRTKEHYFSLECPVEYIDPRYWTAQDIEINNNFVNRIHMDNPEYIAYAQIRMGSYLCGDISRTIDIYFGEGKNGKSLLMKAVSLILGEFVGVIDPNLVATSDANAKIGRGGNGGATSHLMALINKRLVYTDELQRNDVLNEGLVKRIASGDAIGGCRDLYQRKTITIYPFCKLVVTTNHVPQMDPEGYSLKDRLLYQPFNSRFISPKEWDVLSEKGELTSTHYLLDEHMLEKFGKTGRPINIFFSWLVQGCMKFYEAGPVTFKNIPSIVTEFKDKIFEKNDPIASNINLFLNDCCNQVNKLQYSLLSTNDKKKYNTSLNTLFSHWIMWAQQNTDFKGVTRNVMKVFLSNEFTLCRFNGDRNTFQGLQMIDFPSN